MAANSEQGTSSDIYACVLSIVLGIGLAVVGGSILLCSLSRPPAGAGALVLSAFTLTTGLLLPVLGSIAYRASREAMYWLMVVWTMYLVLFNVAGMRLLDHDPADIPVMVTASSLLWGVYMYVLHRLSAPGWNVTGWMARERQGRNRRAGGPELSTRLRDLAGRVETPPVGQGRAGGGRSWRGPFDR
jgi:hypothetical protein